jgi:hypothetical protein
MANPNSLLVKVRFRLVRWLDPFPDQGEAWCINCVMNDGRTIILSASGHLHHVEQHREITEDHPVADAIAIRVNWGHLPTSGNHEED